MYLTSPLPFHQVIPKIQDTVSHPAELHADQSQVRFNEPCVSPSSSRGTHPADQSFRSEFT